MRRSLEDRRLAIVEALGALRHDHEEQRARHRLDVVEQRVEHLEARLDDTLERLASVETTLLESAWEQPGQSEQPEQPEQPVDEEPGSAVEDEPGRVSVPPVPSAGRMSAVAARALFGDR